MSILNLATLAKTATSGTQYLEIEDSSNYAKYKFLLQSLFPSLSTTGAGGESLFVSVTNSNQLNFKGLKSEDATKLSVTTDTNNLILTLLESGIDLDNCDNSVAGFLKTIAFEGTVTGANAVVNGGTGLSTIAAGAVLYASATNVLSATAAMSTNGQLLIGNASTGVPSLATLSEGANITITNTAGAITIAASLETLTANLNASTFNINLAFLLGESWISGDGTDEGMAVNDAGKVFIGGNTPNSFYTSALNIEGSISFASGTAPTISPVSATGATNGVATTISGAGAVAAGGVMNVKGGDSSGSGAGGAAVIAGGTSGSGTAGSVIIKTAGATAATVDENQNITLEGDIKARKGMYMRNTNSPDVIKYQGTQATTDDGTTVVSAANIATGIVQCTPTALRSKATDTAANLISTLLLDVDGDAFDFSIINLTTDGTQNVTLTSGSGVTLVGNMVIHAQDTADDAVSIGTGRFRIARTGGSAVTMFRIG
jgi:hypothetical protein